MRRLAACAGWVAIHFAVVAASGDDGQPARLSVAADARPIELNAPQADNAGADAKVATGMVRFNSPGSAPAGVDFRDSGDSTAAGVLRWKSRQNEQETVTTGFAARPAEGAWQDRSSKSATAVLPITHRSTTAPIAFQDPFGDNAPQPLAGVRLTASKAATALAQERDEGDLATAADRAPVPPETLLAGRDSLGRKRVFPHHADRARMRVNVAQGTAAQPSLAPLGAGESFVPDFPTRQSDKLGAPLEPGRRPSEQGPASSAPLTPAAPSLGPPSAIIEREARPTDTSCTRIYNDRNCCDEDQKCATARQALRDNSITKISLDISAPFKPDAESVEEEREMRESRFRQMPARQWRDRTGRVVADGRVENLRNRTITVSGTTGTPVDLRLGELSDDDLCFLASWWGVPTECTLGDDQYASRDWELVTFTWKASALCHKPLYFEEVGVERYGHTMGPWLEPVHSGAHFFKNVALLPYKMGINPPHECQYALGYYRPGSCAPWLVPPFPVSLRGGLMQAGAVVGGVFLIP